MKDETNPIIEDAQQLVKFFEGKSHYHAKMALNFALGLISDQAVITYPDQFQDES